MILISAPVIYTCAGGGGGDRRGTSVAGEDVGLGICVSVSVAIVVIMQMQVCLLKTSCLKIK